ncbi:MAG TPA: hypothetical protein VGD98_13725 [Ktedonobacteraceae bacterium]
MSTTHRHSLKKSNQSQRKRSSRLPVRKSGTSPARAWRSLKRLGKSPWLWACMVVLVILIGLGTWYAVSPRDTSAASTARSASSRVQGLSTATPIWHTVRTLNGSSTGNATQKTATFTVSSNWQITWDCQGKNGVDDWLYVAIYNPDGTLYNAGAQVTCIAAKNVEGSVQEAKKGTFYLTVDANTDWTLTIQQA